MSKKLNYYLGEILACHRVRGYPSLYLTLTNNQCLDSSLPNMLQCNEVRIFSALFTLSTKSVDLLHTFGRQGGHTRVTVSVFQFSGGLGNGFSFLRRSWPLVAWRSLSSDLIQPLCGFISSVYVRPGHQVRHIFTSFVVKMFRHLFH